MAGLDLEATLSWGWGVLALLGVLGLILLYNLWLKRLPGRFRWWIVGLRLIFLVFVFILLLDPTVQWARNVLVPPRVGVFLDNSLSMDNHPTASATTVISQVNTVIDWAEERDYELLLATFGEKLTRYELRNFEYDPSERITDFNVLEEVWQTADLQACFLFSDGVATSGMDPSAIGVPENLPIFTVGVGDTTYGVDLSILDVRYPLSMLAQEQSTVKVLVRGRGAQGHHRRLYLFHEGEIIYDELITFESQEHIQEVEARVVGRLDATHFRADLEVLPQEANIDNNRRDFQIDVLPGKRQITLLSGALSPNTSLVKSTVRQVRQATVDHLYFLRGRWIGDEVKFWRTPQDLVILDNYPTTSLPDGHLDRLLDKLRRENTRILVVEGPGNHNLEFMRTLRTLGLIVVRTGDSLNVVHPLTPHPQPVASSTSAAGPTDRNPADFPPAQLIHVLPRSANRRLTSLLVDESDGIVFGFGELRTGKHAAMLLPALASLHLNSHRTDWRNYLLDMLNDLMEWMLEPQGFSPYVIQPDRHQYHLGERVQLRGLMRDRAGTKMLQPTLSVEVQGPQDTVMAALDYNFGTSEYEGDYWPGEPGFHTFRVLDQSGEYIQPAGAGFQVQAGRVELETLVQNRYGLERLSQTTGGVYVSLEQVDSLLSELAYSTKTTHREYHYSLWQIRHLWIGLVLLLSVEWSIRRFAGLL